VLIRNLLCTLLSTLSFLVLISSLQAGQEVSTKESTEPALPENFSFSSQTTFRAFEMDTGESEDTPVLPLYE
jgi:hypothetical protein